MLNEQIKLINNNEMLEVLQENRINMDVFRPRKRFYWMNFLSVLDLSQLSYHWAT